MASAPTAQGMGYLKLLMVKDFKSWRGEQLIGPFMRFNCIIGPNGSGKSNIMDAVSFVLCEKIANLRVKSVRELIHGAHVGRPVSSTASVKIVYCEESGEEKTFSRVIRDGCSEYIFNDKSITRSAYISELEKIGILVKARNCLIFQGTVESIAMKKPKERTQLFEQISNSWQYAEEYERKKKKMQQAEEDAHFNYNKKKNIAAERKQAKLEKEEAEHYQMLVSELDAERIQLQLFQLYHNERSIESLKESLNEKNTEARIKKDSLSTAEDDFRAKKKELGALNRDQQHIEREMKTLQASLIQQKALYIKAKENTSHQIKKVEMSKRSLRDKEKYCDKEKQNIKELEMELHDIEKLWREFEKETQEEILLRVEHVELRERQLERYKELKEIVRRKVATLTQQLGKLRWEQKADEERMKLYQRKKKDIKETIVQTEEQIEEYKKKVEKLEEYTKKCTESLTEEKKKEEMLAEEMENSTRRIAEVNEELNKVVGELQNARIDYHEGKRQQMRAEIVESLKRLYPDSVFGRLLDLCHPIHKKYQLAVTKVFSKYVTAIVVATEKTARDCIQFLKQERAEPETFLALDYLEVKPINERLREIKGAKMIVDVVQTSFPPLKKVIQFVSGNGLVCETVKEARHIAFDGPVRLTTVALDGTLFQKSGVISGGSSDLRVKARCWDDKEINKMKERRDSLITELKDLMKIKRKEADLKQLQAQCHGTQTRLKYSQSELDLIKKKHLPNLYMEKSKLESELLNTESQRDMIKEGVVQRKLKIEEFQKQINEAEDAVFREFCEEIGIENIRVYEQEHMRKLEEIEKRRLEFENQKTRLSVQMEYNREHLQKITDTVNKLRDTIHKDESAITGLQKDEEKHLKRVKETEEEEQHLKDRLSAQKSEIIKVQSETEELRRTFLTLNREAAKLQKEAAAIEASLEDKRLRRHNMLLECKVQDLKINLLFGSLDDISEVELGTETEDTQTTGIYEREEAIQIDYSSLPKDLKDLESDKEIEAHLDQIEQEIKSKESILMKTAVPNLRAVEKLQVARNKFQESTEAFESSRKEARISKQEFEEVKKRRYELFSQCFEHASVVIDQVYKKLCRNNSAQAFLSPENPEEPYLEGIGFNCVAPGKRFMPMDSLSGGEKTVAALALIFAVHSFRPAPFFILDEIDAALDNTNIDKVSIFIREQAHKQFQMVVISLKEEFYSKADALIGVCPERDDYMFSRVLTLDLTQYPEDEEETENHKRSPLE
ncbi:structural maintenance of chromosomes protein 1B [Coturnix japonica]|uniref:Structural maintenance of chromosomes protein n=1 Tax=Coturnix japonica TaxID=93934 RepID=A0A8C2U1E1_COTJA|nr:structural maintenance of chromosomes protein 1B [Coturnix japonica]XP_015725966.1 structural maintenance of chromosomes protein 1B [Coturnix japonica]XP_032302405.1 structural maintenance of chromosomes protein 1B [Coturnix japonica]